MSMNVRLSHDPEVIAWVRKRIEDDMNREQIVAASREGEHDWPRPGESLTNGSVGECRAAIAAYQDAGRGLSRAAAEGIRDFLRDDIAVIRRALDRLARDLDGTQAALARARTAVDDMEEVPYDLLDSILRKKAELDGETASLTMRATP